MRLYRVVEKPKTKRGRYINAIATKDKKRKMRQKNRKGDNILILIARAAICVSTLNTYISNACNTIFPFLKIY